jgi:cytochrome c2
MKFSVALVDIGLEAAKIAESKNPEAVLEVGERVYNVCTQCHEKYIVEEE